MHSLKTLCFLKQRQRLSFGRFEKHALLSLVRFEALESALDVRAEVGVWSLAVDLLMKNAFQ
jgi:hypothetical protein